MSGRAEGVRIGTTSLRLLPSDPSMVSLLPPKSEEDQKELQSLSVARNESVMSSRAPRIQNLSNGKASAATAAKHAEPAPVTPVPTLDPVHRQKIIQLRLQAAKASMNRGRSFRRENVSRLAFWLLRTTLWLAGIFSLTIFVVSFPLAVDPALESIWRSFSTRPVMCLTSDIQIQHSRNPDGSVKRNDACTWTSCRQGCTGELFRCVQLFANISRVPWDMLESTNTTPWLRDDDSPPVQTGRRPKRATNWAISWATTADQQAFNKSSIGSRNDSVNPLHERQNANAQLQFARLMKELGQPERTNDSDLFQATNVRLMINIRGCGYVVDCAQFHRTAAVIGSLIPCHLSSRGDVMVAVMEHNPQQDENIIFFLMTVPVSVFCSAVFLLCCIHHQCCWPQCVAFMTRRSSVEYSVARLAINSSQFGGQLSNLHNKPPPAVTSVPHQQGNHHHYHQTTAATTR